MEPLKKKRSKVRFLYLFVRIKGRSLRITIAYLHDKEQDPDRNIYRLSFSFQSPKEKEDIVKIAKSEAKQKLFNFEEGKYFFVEKKKIFDKGGKPIIKNLVVLALAFTILLQDVSWVDKDFHLEVK